MEKETEKKEVVEEIEKKENKKSKPQKAKASKSVRIIAKTAILLALVIIVQMVGRLIPAPANNFIVGPLVNACLLIATAATGLWGGVIISIIAPFTSLINNHSAIASVLLPFAPFVAVGNIVFVIAFSLIMKKNEYVAAVVSSVLKFGFLWGAIISFLQLTGITQNKEALVSMFSLPQLITALMGSMIAILVIKALGKNIE